MAIERYISVCHPLTKPNANTGVYTIAGLVVFSVAFNVCRFLEFETTYETVVSREDYRMVHLDLLRKLEYFKCCLRDLFLFLV